MKGNIINPKAIVCPTCGKFVIPKVKTICVRKGSLMSFYEDIKVCPNRRCGERIY